jgi:hypothetical protein
VFGRLRLVFAGLAVVFIVAAGLDHNSLLRCALGLALGALLALYMVFRDLPPLYIECWRTGFEGERYTPTQVTVLTPE